MAIDKIILGATDNLFENTEFTGTEGIRVPKGTTAERPAGVESLLRFNTTIGKLEQYDGVDFRAIDSPPVISGIGSSSLPADDTAASLAITGDNFSDAAIVQFIGQNGSTVNATSTTKNSAQQLTATVNVTALDNAQEPYSVKVTNNTGLSITYADVLYVNATPVWTTAASPTLLTTMIQSESLSSVSVEATDDEGSALTYALDSGSLPTGTTVNSDGTITGTPSGGTYASGGESFTPVISVTDGQNTVTRTFNILRKWRDGSTSALAASTADAIKQLTGTTTSTDYWINCNGTPRQIFCDMDGTYVGGNSNNDPSKGYMLLMAFGNSNSTLNNALAHTSKFYWADPNGGGSGVTAASAFGLTTNSDYGGPAADNQAHYIGSNPIGYLAQTRSSFNSDTAGFTISRINVKGGHPYTDGGVRLYINETEISPILSSHNGTYTWEANNGSSSNWAWYMNESSSTPSISSIYHVFVR
jgi:hypothetical protein